MLGDDVLQLWVIVVLQLGMLRPDIVLQLDVFEMLDPVILPEILVLFFMLVMVCSVYWFSVFTLMPHT